MGSKNQGEKKAGCWLITICILNLNKFIGHKRLFGTEFDIAFKKLLQ
jgi:hypothetical protein